MATTVSRADVSGTDPSSVSQLAASASSLGLPSATALVIGSIFGTAQNGQAAAKVAPTQAERLSGLLVRRGRLVRIAGILFHAEALDRLKREVVAMKAGGQTTVDIGTFKDRYGVSRKYAIPLLEYLDRERVTRRTLAGRLIL